MRLQLRSEASHFNGRARGYPRSIVRVWRFGTDELAARYEALYSGLLEETSTSLPAAA